MQKEIQNKSKNTGLNKKQKAAIFNKLRKTKCTNLKLFEYKSDLNTESFNLKFN